MATSSKLPKGWNSLDSVNTTGTPDAINPNDQRAAYGLNFDNPAWLQSLGYTGPTGPGQIDSSSADGGSTYSGGFDPAAFQQWAQSQGLNLGTNVNPSASGASEMGNLAAFNGQGQQVGNTNTWDLGNDNQFGAGLLGAALFATAGAAGIGAGGASGAAGSGASGLSSSDLGALYGDAGYGGTGATGASGATSGLGGLSSNAVNFASDPAFSATAAGNDMEAAAASDAGGGSLGGAAPGTANATGGLLGNGTGILGSNVTGTQVANGLGTAAKFATSPAGGALIGAAGGLLGNSTGLNSATTTASKSIDPRLVPYIYGSNGTSGLLGNTASLYNQQMATGGLNANQTAGLNSQLSVLNNPSYSNGFNQERTLGSSLLNQGVAGNPFTQAPTAYGGAPTTYGSSGVPQFSMPPTNLSQIGKATTMPVYSGAPNRASGGLL